MKPFFFFLCFLFLFGCEKATKYNSSPRDNFEALWRIMDENYCFFAFKDVDWDDVYVRLSRSTFRYRALRSVSVT